MSIILPGNFLDICEKYNFDHKTLCDNNKDNKFDWNALTTEIVSKFFKDDSETPD